MTAGAVLLLCLAGGVGSVLRVVVDGEVRLRLGGGPPWGTAVVNVTGSFVIGLVTGLLAAPPDGLGTGGGALLPVLATGFCGGYTTFGTAVVEVLRLAEQRRGRAALAAAGAAVVLGVVAAASGLVVGRALA